MDAARNAGIIAATNVHTTSAAIAMASATGNDQAKGTAEDQPKHSSRIRTESHADAYLAGALSNAVRRYAIQSNGSQQQRDDAEQTSQTGHRPLLAERKSELVPSRIGGINRS